MLRSLEPHNAEHTSVPHDRIWLSNHDIGCEVYMLELRVHAVQLWCNAWQMPDAPAHGDKDALVKFQWLQRPAGLCTLQCVVIQLYMCVILTVHTCTSLPCPWGVGS